MVALHILTGCNSTCQVQAADIQAYKPEVLVFLLCPFLFRCKAGGVLAVKSHIPPFFVGTQARGIKKKKTGQVVKIIDEVFLQGNIHSKTLSLAVVGEQEEWVAFHQIECRK